MKAETIELDRAKARELWRAYRKHAHYSAPIDEEVMRAYKAIAQGRVVIRALDSIKNAGLGDDGLPKLAIARANEQWCWFDGNGDGSAVFTTSRRELWSRQSMKHSVRFARGSFPATVGAKRGQAIVPTIPLPLRPKRGLENYHVLFEAEWTALPPVDPMLLRRVGRADLWIVCAAWDLTPVEQAALAARMHA